jgi:hypothetical protein
MIVDASTLPIAAAVGLLSGTHTAIWGMYKDAAHEGFNLGRFTRSMIVGVLAAVGAQAALQLALPGTAALVVLFGLAYAIERGLVEVWKTFLREEDQSKYFIPMQFSMRGVPVKSRAQRLAYGAGYVGIIALCFVAIGRLDQTPAAAPSMVKAALVGLAVGMIIALGGGWKDAPKEGFDLLKFFRSPIMTVLYAVILSRLTDSYLQMAAAAIGYERATAETYKTFFFPSKPRGKFTGKPITHPQMLKRRQHFVPAYFAISVAAVVFMFIAAL